MTDSDQIDKNEFNKLVSHPLQSFEWGEFREKTGTKVIRRISGKNAFQLTVHNAPLGFKIGYLPKSYLPTKELIEELRKIGRNENLVYIQLEPNVLSDQKEKIEKLNLKKSFHPLFTKYNFVLDLTKSEEEILKNMHPKTRYNIKVAQKHNVEVKQNNSENAFKKYLELTEETTKRQGFYAHTKKYHTLMWETLKSDNVDSNELSEHLFTASYKGEILTTWMLFIFKDTLYYPYGASSSEYREAMHSTLMCWEVIKFGKSLGLKKFDMWGALSKNPDPNHEWFGFHNFKQKFGPEHIELAGSFDLVINSLIYSGARLADKARWMYLNAKPK